MTETTPVAGMVEIERPIEDYDDYQTAAQYLIKLSLVSGDGKALRSIKAVMDGETKVRKVLLAVVKQFPITKTLAEQTLATALEEQRDA